MSFYLYLRMPVQKYIHTRKLSWCMLNSHNPWQTGANETHTWFQHTDELAAMVAAWNYMHLYNLYNIDIDPKPVRFITGVVATCRSKLGIFMDYGQPFATRLEANNLQPPLSLNYHWLSSQPSLGVVLATEPPAGWKWPNTELFGGFFLIKKLKKNHL